MQSRQVGLLLVASFITLAVTDALAQGYTTRAAFNAALPGPATTNGFDGVVAGTTVASGGSVAGVTFTYNLSGTLIKVSNAYPAVSAGNALGTNDADIFQDGDSLTLGFAATNALGINIITKEPLQNGDMTLSAGGRSVSIAGATVQQVLADGSNVYFLGVINASTAFTTATLATIGGGYFFYNLDSFVTARAADTDNDGITNSADDCTNAPNGNLIPDAGGHSQLDADGDGYGNICDGDLNNSGRVTVVDYTILRNALNTTNAVADLNGSGRVTVVDYTLLRNRLNLPPGPSGLHP